MIRVKNIEIPVENDTINSIKLKITKKYKIDKILAIKIVKKSLDARHKPRLVYTYTVDITISNEKAVLKINKELIVSPKEEYTFNITGQKILEKSIVITGSGPCGLFCGYILSKNGYKVVIIERGSKVEERVKEVEKFFTAGVLNINSNIQYGEGGAGTFSDGKLNTLIKDKVFRQKEIFKIFVENGAPEEILYLNKPHIGTDILRNVIKNMREKIISFGGEFRFNTCLTNINYKDQKIVSIEVNNKEIIATNILVLAIGHSARDTFEMLYKNNFNIQSKPFAVGVRVQHTQEMINKSQYGENYFPQLEPASYKLTYNNNDRGVYTFCMCPGGYVVNASSEQGLLAVNGMSNYKRESSNANSAVIVTVTKKDFGEGVLDGVEFQRRLEKLCYIEGKGKIPVQLYKDFKNNKSSISFLSIKPLVKGSYTFGNLRNILPDYISNALISGIDNFENKIKGFSIDDTLLLGVESRTSSPIRIIRNEDFESNIKGVYPAGEGAGYAGGITSAAIDGIKIAEQIAKIYKPNQKINVN